MCTASANCTHFFKNSVDALAPVDMTSASGFGLYDVNTVYVARYPIAHDFPSWRPNSASFFFFFASTRLF